MLLSMTGQGQATTDKEGTHVQVELRAVNNRHLKVSARVSDLIARFEPMIEGILRSKLKRGSIQAIVHVRRPISDQDYRINRQVLAGYMSQATEVARSLKLEVHLDAGAMLSLPGVVETDQLPEDDDDLIQLATSTVDAAADQLNLMRLREGTSMAKQLVDNIQQLKSLSRVIEERAPTIIIDYQNRLETKIKKMLASLGIEYQMVDLLREVQIFADRTDIREELVRLNSHFDQFLSAIEEPESQGRKLDFLIQEVFREINTIGSKGNDSQIAHTVVQMKTLVEQMREIVQNVE